MPLGQADRACPHERLKMGVRRERESFGGHHRGGDGGTRRGGPLIELRRRKFVMSHLLTTLAVSLLICACLTLEVCSDSQASFRKVFSTEPLADSNGPTQRGSAENGAIASKASSAPSSTPSSTSSAPTPLVGGRQPRATTRRRTTSTSTTTPAGAGTSSTLSAAQTETEPPITSAPKPLLIGARTMRLANKKLTPEEEAAQDEADAAAEAEEAERASARRRRLRTRKKLLSAPSSQQTSPTDLLTTTTNNPLSSISSSSSSSSSTTDRAPNIHRLSASGESSSSTTKKVSSSTLTLGGRHLTGNYPQHSNSNSNSSEEGGLELNGHERTADEAEELDYEDEFTASSRAPASTTPRHKTIDFDKMKLVDANNRNETHTSDKEKKKKWAQDGARQANETTSSPADGTLEPIGLHDEREPLDARSPSVKKRLNGLIADTRSRLRSPSTQAAGSSTRHFSYSKPTSTTEMPPSSPTTLVTTTSPPGLIVQVMNQTAAGEPTGRLVTLNETAARLDWSKLVKVMFKSARDNQTIYTLVMNSSELSNHPISDWSNELPGLLRRDFEKLKEKWLHVFPDLMTDLAAIITSKHPINGTLKPSSEADSTRLPSLKLTPSTTPEPNASASTTTAPQSTSPMSSSSFNQTITSNTTQTALTPTSTPVALNSATNASTSTNQTTSIAPVAVDNSTVVAHQQDISNSGLAVQSRQLNGTLTSLDGYKRTNPNGSVINQVQSGTGGFTQERHLNGTQAEGGVIRNRTMDEMMEDIREENMKIEDDVREQGSSLKHFIIICSISTVVATSLVVALILLLLK